MSQPFKIKYGNGWCDVTHEIETADPPLTLARPDGVGAFQFSIAHYRSGVVPNPSPEILLSMLRKFASSHELGEPTEIITETGMLCIAAASFQNDNNFIRIWYVSDGRNFAKITYTCAFGKQHTELSECEQMVRTLKFAA